MRKKGGEDELGWWRSFGWKESTNLDNCSGFGFTDDMGEVGSLERGKDERREGRSALEVEDA